MTQPDPQQAEDKREHAIGPGSEPLSILGQTERLQAKGREGGVTAANAEHEELAKRGGYESPTTLRPGEAGKYTDEERTTDVDQQCAIRKSLTDRVGNPPGGSPPGETP